MQLKVLQTASQLASDRQPFALATVIRVEGSSSARVGSKAVIDSRGKLLCGWAGGGCAEGAVRRAALECIEAAEPRTILVDLMDEVLGVGMPCGGIMEVFIEPVLPRPQLVILGHGRIAEAMAKLGAVLHFHVTVNDPSADRQAFPEADRLFTDDFDLSQCEIGRDSYLVIATQHKGDHRILRRALASDAPYIALVASRHRAKLVLDDLVAAGEGKSLGRVHAPAGLDIGAATPEEIALSVLGQIVALRRGANGQLKESRRFEMTVVRTCDR